MIIILKRDELPDEYRNQAFGVIDLKDFKLSPELIEQTESIVLVEGTAVRFLKNHQEIQSKNTLEILVSYIISMAPITKESQPFSLKRFGHRREKR